MEKIKIVKLQGGMGNQMFQYAFGKGLESKFGCKVLFDKINYDELQKTIINNTGKNAEGICVRKYELGIFNLNIDFATAEQIQECIGEKPNKVCCLPGFIRKIFNLSKNKTLSNRIFEKKYGEYDEDLLKDYPLAYYDGYFQNSKYFENISDKIKKEFTLPAIKNHDIYNKNLLERITQFENSVFIHVRRDDYLNINCEIDLDYYQKAVKYILQHVENPKFFVFCAEDPDYIKNHFDIGYDFELIGENNKTQDTYYENMRLMMACKHAIIANSSYSWWAAWLSDYDNKIVIAPTPWLPGISNEIICTNWIQIKRGISNE